MTQTALAVAFLVTVFVLPAGSQGTSQITPAEAENAAHSAATLCKTLIVRMQNRATVLDDLDCHPVFEVDERVHWLLR